jgi:hypothetical protein
MSIVSIACLTGPPIAGALIDAAGGRYLYMQVWSGAVMLLGGSFVAGAYVARLKTDP